MKFRLSLELLVLSLLLPAVGNARNVVSRSELFDGTEYQFLLSDSELVKAPDWNATKPVPPLDPGKASDLARAYLDKLTKGKNIAWNLSSITLNKVSFQPERWIYEIGFIQDVSAYGAWIGPVQSFVVVVYLSGDIVDPVISHRKSPEPTPPPPPRSRGPVPPAE